MDIVLGKNKKWLQHATWIFQQESCSIVDSGSINERCLIHRIIDYIERSTYFAFTARGCKSYLQLNETRKGAVSCEKKKRNLQRLSGYWSLPCSIILEGKLYQICIPTPTTLKILHDLPTSELRRQKKTSILRVMNDTLLLVLSPPSLRDLAVEFIHFFGGHLLPPIDNSWRGGLCVCVGWGGVKWGQGVCETEIIALYCPQRGRWILFPFAHCARAAKTWEINEAHNDG